MRKGEGKKEQTAKELMRECGGEWVVVRVTKIRIHKPVLARRTGNGAGKGDRGYIDRDG